LTPHGAPDTLLREEKVVARPATRFRYGAA
jgi:hypothetical protein